MNSVDDCHERPEGGVLQFGGHHASEHPVAAEPLEEGSEKRAVPRVESECSPGPSPREPAE